MSWMFKKFESNHSSPPPGPVQGSETFTWPMGKAKK